MPPRSLSQDKEVRQRRLVVEAARRLEDERHRLRRCVRRGSLRVSQSLTSKVRRSEKQCKANLPIDMTRAEASNEKSCQLAERRGRKFRGPIKDAEAFYLFANNTRQPRG